MRFPPRDESEPPSPGSGPGTATLGDDGSTAGSSRFPPREASVPWLGTTLADRPSPPMDGEGLGGWLTLGSGLGAAAPSTGRRRPPNALVSGPCCSDEWRRLGVAIWTPRRQPHCPQAAHRLRRPHQRTPCSDHLPSTSKVASLQLVKTLPIISGISSSAGPVWTCFCWNLEYR